LFALSNRSLQYLDYEAVTPTSAAAAPVRDGSARDTSTVSLRSVVTDACRCVRASTSLSGVLIECRVLGATPDRLTIRGDYVMDMLINMLHFAVARNPTAGSIVLVHVSVKSPPADQHRVDHGAAVLELCVSDCGPRLSDEQCALGVQPLMSLTAPAPQSILAAGASFDLGIAQIVAGWLGGTLHISNRVDICGACVTARIPCAAVPLVFEVARQGAPAPAAAAAAAAAAVLVSDLPLTTRPPSPMPRASGGFDMPSRGHSGSWRSAESSAVPVSFAGRLRAWQKSLGPDTSARALVVDDNPINVLVLKRILQRISIESDTASDGQQALTILTASHSVYSVVLMDLHMPRMDGLTATRLLRDMERDRGLRPVPVVAVTASVTPGVEQLCQEVGMNGFVSKPVVIVELEAQLVRAILES
jgi:CheY-like chemotaxis protein